ncbi:HGWP repeat containing protein-like [Oryza sativa Japonica Group]|uniref:cysteine dioxygenase n=1 Tax=Oryza sativa subsp. japonica TaxID=39947 RepID=Q5NAV2_ORYSJ|nr:HGWP repeat containing protein-like [Oryza sativa Japonica Group]
MALSLSLTLQEWISQNITTGSPRPPPTGVSACTAGLYAAVVGPLRLHRPACLRRRRLVFPPARLAFMPPLLGVYVFTDRFAFAAADWCFRLHGWPLCRRCWASTSSPTGRLVRRRLVFPPARLAFMPPLLGVYVFTDRLAFAAADWCPRLHGWPIMTAIVGRLHLHRPAASTAADWYFRLYGWPIMPPLLGVYVFTDRPPRPPPTGVSSCTAGLYAAVVGRLRLHRPACLRRRRLVFPPARLAFMPPLLGVYVFTDRLAFAAADWCPRLHGWPIMTAVVGHLRLHRLACLRRRRLVFPPARLAYYATVVGRLRLHRPACLRRRRLVFPPARLAFMPPLLGIYVFTDRLAFAAADWCFRLHGWPLCRRCWASTSSPTGLPSPPPTGVSACTASLYAAVVGRLRLHRPACLRRCRLVFPPARLAFMPPLLGIYVFTDRPPRPPPTDVSTCTAGLLCCRCWASTSSPTGRRIRR